MTEVPIISADRIDDLLDVPSVIDALRSAFARPPAVPPRTQHEIPGGRLLVMPAWADDGIGGVKLGVALPANRNTDLPEIQATYVLYDARGRLCALMDGHALTLWRTAATSALAASILARPDARRLLVVGAGALGYRLAEAHADVRPIESVRIWSRTRDSAERAAERLRGVCADVAMARTLADEIPKADLITCATPSTTPLFAGEHVPPGCHVDLVGAYTPFMREGDPLLLSRARLFVDTREGALTEAGDVIQAIESGAIRAEDILGNLTDLVRGAPGRLRDMDVTVFKSVGHALEDLVAARLVYKRFTDST